MMTSEIDIMFRTARITYILYCANNTTIKEKQYITVFKERLYALEA